MNDADKKAFETACKDWQTKSAGKDLGEYFWQAACEWRDSQVGQPFGYFNNPHLDGWQTCAETDEGAIALYEDPPPAQINQQLVEALEKLHAVVIAKNRAGASWGDQFTDLMVALSLAQAVLQSARGDTK